VEQNILQTKFSQTPRLFLGSIIEPRKELVESKTRSNASDIVRPAAGRDLACCKRE
jgi:hypothetical protein